MCLSVYLGTNTPLDIPGDIAPGSLGIELSAFTPPPLRRNHQFTYYLGRKGNGEKVGLFVFDRLANGDVAPKQFIGGPSSKLAHFRQVAIDPETGNIFLAQQNTRMKQMEAYVLDKPRQGFKAKGSADEDDDGDSGRLDQMGFIAVYGPDDNGDIPPRAIIKGPGIRLAGAAGVALNPRKKEIIAVGGNGFQTFLLPEFFRPLKKLAGTVPQ